MRVRVASAGTGKTYSLVMRYLELIAGGTPLRRIAGVTFTRKSADELRQRVGDAISLLIEQGSFESFTLTGSNKPLFEEARRELDGAVLSTIHGFMGSMLRLCSPYVGIDPDFKMIDELEAQTLFEEEFLSLKYLSQNTSHIFSKVDFDQISEAVLKLFSKRSLAEEFTATDESKQMLEIYNHVFAAYNARLGGRVLSASDVERKALQLIRIPRALARIAERVKVLMVDEYQDVNPVQGKFFSGLGDAGIPTEVVGDPKQSIYGFRNADLEVFREALKKGEALEPLSVSRRHSQSITWFLNHACAYLGENERGFTSLEAPVITTTRTERGSVEALWVMSDGPVAELRANEALALARRFKELSVQYRFEQMAVLVKAFASADVLEKAFALEGVPYVLGKGRGYFERQEIRDLFHAMHAALGTNFMHLMAWLRGPFGSLSVSEIDLVMKSDNVEATLHQNHPVVYERLLQIRNTLISGESGHDSKILNPLEALSYLARERIIEGKSLQEILSIRARENVDALLFYFAAKPVQDLESLLEELEKRSNDREAGEVPQSGSGVQILTIHGSKGLEWPVVAVFDMGRGAAPARSEAVWISPPKKGDVLSAQVALEHTVAANSFKASAVAKQEQESFRLFYVAISRARDVLILTGSVSRGRPSGWMALAEPLDISQEAQASEGFPVTVSVLPNIPVELREVEKDAFIPEKAPWTAKEFFKNPFPPVSSPSSFQEQRLEAEGEPVAFSGPEYAEAIPGKSRAVGTLVHYAIGNNWNDPTPAQCINLEVQDVMFPFGPEERKIIMEEVLELIGLYRNMLGKEIPTIREEDHAEIPLALPISGTVWQGVIDRLYCTNGVWFLEDYKTDRIPKPEQYYFQLGIYRRAVQEAWGHVPICRLVYLRSSTVVELDPDLLEGEIVAVEYQAR